MRRMFGLLAAALLILLPALRVSAVTGASSLESHSSVTSGGECQVSLVVTLHIEQAQEQLDFPIPKNASDVTLNGSRAKTASGDGVRLISLTNLLGGFAGDFTVNIHYSLGDVVQTGENGEMILSLPLLSGFAYPVQAMTFSVTLPGDITEEPNFSSGYHQENIELYLNTTVSGATVSGACETPLKDHETLTMTLAVPETMFPRTVAQARSFHWVDTAMLICAIAALAYWLLFLRSGPLLRQYRVTPPEGLSAGQVGSILTLQGPDLTLTVLSWAQLGYVLIQPDRNGRVLLHKRMDMGNERSNLERKYFRALFGSRQTVDACGLRYARLGREMERASSGIQELMRRRSGNLKLFRALAAGVGLFGGVWLGRCLAGGSAMRYLLALILGLAGAVGSWHIQSWGGCLFQRKKRGLAGCIFCCGGWLILSLAAGETAMGLGVILFQLIAGLLAAFGGRRTERGRQAAAQLLGLRRYMKKVSKEELRRIQARNPDYFFTLAPYALALDVDKAFASRFGNGRLHGCPYLTTGMDKHMTALEWSRLIRRTAKEMDARRRQMPTERLLGVLRGITRP